MHTMNDYTTEHLEHAEKQAAWCRRQAREATEGSGTRQGWLVRAEKWDAVAEKVAVALGYAVYGVAVGEHDPDFVPASAKRAA